MDYLSGLNEKQREAVLHTEGPLLIVAGAGAGKTKTLTYRIVHIVQSLGVTPSEILAVTFTNKAAKEMRERVEKLLEGKNYDSMPLLSTFHSLGVRIIKENAHLLGLTKHFTIADESDALSIIKDSLKDLGLDPKQYEPRKIKSVISKLKGDFVTREDFREKINSGFEEIVYKVWEKYESSLKREGSLDFDDLLLKTVLLLKNHQEVRHMYHKRWKYIHIDEYQDTNEVQYKLVGLLVNEKENICVVGDTDQNIYSWRGANIKNMLHFEKDYPNAKLVMLEQNYRSTKTIIEAANEIIKKNQYRAPKNLFTKNEEGEMISLFEAYDEYSEARFIAGKCRELLESKDATTDEIAVLYRANFQSRVLEEAFLDAGVPYQVLGVKFFERKEVKDVLSYIRASRNKDSLSDIKRIINTPGRGIGKTTIAKLFANQFSELPKSMQEKINSFYIILDAIGTYSQQNTVSETIKFTIKKSGLEEELMNSGEEGAERLANIKELVSLAVKYDSFGTEGMDMLLADASLASDQDSLAEKKTGVKLMTVHASKGLEFKYVFISGLEQDLFPQDRHQKKSNGEEEEERRLFYVALTRAEKKLHLSYSMLRTIFGARCVNTPSEFIADLPQDLLKYEENPNSEKIVYI